MNFPLIANIVVFVVLLFALAQTRHKQWSLAKKVLVGLVMGVVFGLALHTIYGSDSQVLKDSVQWFNIVGNGYVQLLQMIVMPLVFASILSAVARLHNASQLGKISFLTIGTLLFTNIVTFDGVQTCSFCTTLNQTFSRQTKQVGDQHTNQRCNQRGKQKRTDGQKTDFA